MYQVELSGEQVSAVLARNPEIRSLVLQHNRLFEGTGQWDQIRMNEANYPLLPIPTKGRMFTDSEFGDVVIFPDARGMLHFSGHVATVPGDISKTPFESPAGNTLSQMLEDFKSGFQGIVAGVVIVTVAYLILTHRPAQS